MYQYFNPNPVKRKGIGDCTVRAVAKALDLSWDAAYIDLVLQGYRLADMPSSNMTMDSYLHSKGFSRHVIDNYCPDCYTIEEFSKDHPRGTYIIGTGTHVVALVDGDYFDSWNSGDETPIYYYKREMNP